jgi:hypothetical protein
VKKNCVVRLFPGLLVLERAKVGEKEEEDEEEGGPSLGGGERSAE